LKLGAALAVRDDNRRHAVISLSWFAFIKKRPKVSQPHNAQIVSVPAAVLVQGGNGNLVCVRARIGLVRGIE
jgi:hypothetical protein